MRDSNAKPFNLIPAISRKIKKVSEIRIQILTHHSETHLTPTSGASAPASSGPEVGGNSRSLFRKYQKSTFPAPRFLNKAPITVHVIDSHPELSDNFSYRISDSNCPSQNKPATKFSRSKAFNLSVAAVAEWYRYRIVACLVTSSSPVPLKTRRVGQRCTLNLSRAETSSRWCGVVVRRGGCQLRCRPRHLTMVQNYVVRRQKPSCS
ncbi:uncharacterized protein TNCV_1035171 [Trichonephila clavipes]|nr:uncharacterized protein TNCV_1035171 [Trichonephila clavipes]